MGSDRRRETEETLLKQHIKKSHAGVHIFSLVKHFEPCLSLAHGCSVAESGCVFFLFLNRIFTQNVLLFNLQNNHR